MRIVGKIIVQNKERQGENPVLNVPVEFSGRYYEYKLVKRTSVQVQVPSIKIQTKRTNHNIIFLLISAFQMTAAFFEPHR